MKLSTIQNVKVGQALIVAGVDGFLNVSVAGVRSIAGHAANRTTTKTAIHTHTNTHTHT